LSANVLLVRYEDADPADADGCGPAAYWVPPGGALKKDEAFRSAAAREVEEGTGRSVEIGPMLWETQFRMRHQGEMIDQCETYFLARVEAEAPPVFNRSPESIVEHRWWRLCELQGSSDRFFPEGFVKLVEPILQGQVPRAPNRI